MLKASFHRGRPPNPLVITHDYSFPSGHAVADRGHGVALVLALMPARGPAPDGSGSRSAFAFVMASRACTSRAHWFSDVVAGVLLGAGIAIFWAAAVDGDAAT